MKNKSTIISNPTDLNSLSSFPFARKRGLGKIQLSDSFQHEERNALEKDLNKHYYACGCSTSSKWLIAGLTIGIILKIIDPRLDFLNLPNSIITIGSLAILGGILGKVLGLYKAQSKLKRVIHTIQAFWRPKYEQPTEPIICG